jgi:metallo-beta-lactamase family protein
MKIQFLGAALQVTGSCYLVEAGGLKMLVDCGIYQERDFRARNWKPFPVAPDDIDFVLLTHVHMDHCGYLPRLVKGGFSGEILATEATKEMYPIVILDSAKIQEEDAAYKKRRHKKEGRKGPHPELPLYTVEDAKRTLPMIKPVSYNSHVNLNDSVKVCWHDAGHILGSAMVEIMVKEEGSWKNLIFSGDMGQWDKPFVKDPTMFDRADYVVMESTYGDRNHDHPEDVEKQLEKVINQTVEAGGNLLIPTFAIERAQEILYHISALARADKIPYLMTFLDSPMAVEITRVFEESTRFMDREARDLFSKGKSPFAFPGLRLIESSYASKAINKIRGSAIIMAGSGMMTGGRIKHHLVQNVTRPDCTLLFVGFQAKGTLGRLMYEGKENVRIHGKTYPVNIRRDQILGFSAHADRRGLLRWLDHFEKPPRRLFLTHGEKDSIMSLASTLREREGWEVTAPEYLAKFELE